MIAAAVVAPNRAVADNGVGKWSAATAAPWPLIPLHAVLNRDGSLLTYGVPVHGYETPIFAYAAIGIRPI